MKEYRQDSHVWPLAAWAALCAAAALFFFAHSGQVLSRALRIEEVAAGAGLLAVGPAALAVYVARARRVWVGVDREQGIVVNGKYLLPWGEIRQVERRRPRLRKESGPAQIKPMEWPDMDPGDAGGCGLWGCMAGIEGSLIVIGFFAFAAAAMIFYWLVFLVAIPVLVVPALEVFAPFGDRIRIVARDRNLVLRDLRGADDFIAEVRGRIPVVES